MQGAAGAFDDGADDGGGRDEQGAGRGGAQIGAVQGAFFGGRTGVHSGTLGAGGRPRAVRRPGRHRSVRFSRRPRRRQSFVIRHDPLGAPIPA
ncbi:hypothetical protein GCM10012285_12460 [Streptomyces kronopolitis]|uniref:Uncharacterized protein n=1 Tax=Streptomyces kronopolitis TaxID=1612435 RepID=A0ABQ2J1J3_9ACTN|nr:hypothetical protein GCM10012285_12460 [Streptomyces kronopolitis]